MENLLTKENVTAFTKAAGEVQKDLAIINLYGLTNETLFITLTHFASRELKGEVAEETKPLLAEQIHFLMEAGGMPVDIAKTKAIMVFVKDNFDFVMDKYGDIVEEYIKKNEIDAFSKKDTAEGTAESFIKHIKKEKKSEKL